jgi:hypothetical protein
MKGKFEMKTIMVLIIAFAIAFVVTIAANLRQPSLLEKASLMMLCPIANACGAPELQSDCQIYAITGHALRF